jgi:urease accessory protein
LCRLVPLGPLAGQRLFHRVLERVPDVLVQAFSVASDEIGASAPRLSIASCLHETQYTRIFRS